MALRERMREGRAWWLLGCALVAAAGVGALIVARARPVVSWTEVLQAAAARHTVHGVGRVQLAEGAEWECAIWAQVREMGECATEAMLRPVGAEAEAGEPDEAVLGVCEAMTYCGEQGLLTRLAGAMGRGAQAQPTVWGGREVLVVEVEARVGLEGPPAGYPEVGRLVLEPETRLLLAMELFAERQGERQLVAWCEYRYGEPLPPGFGGVASDAEAGGGVEGGADEGGGIAQ